MKKLKSLIAVAIAAVLLTSCLNGGSNEDAHTVCAVVKMSDKSFRNLAYENDNYYPIYHPSLSELQDGQCIYAYRRIVLDDETNKNPTEFLTASEFQYQKVDKGQFNSFLRDTSVFNTGEMTTIDVATASYVKNMLFIMSSHPDASNDQTVEMDLSYNAGEEPKEVNGQRVYDLFFRARKLADGKNNKGSQSFLSAFPMDYFFSSTSNIEKNKGQTSVYFRFNFIKEFSKDSTSVVWGTSKVIQYPIPEK